MPKNYTSPYATSFKSAIKRGTSYNVAVQNLAKKHNKTTDFIWQSLFKANLCWRQKFNGQWVYFPCELNQSNFNAPVVKDVQFNCWQWFCEWCLINGVCTPQQLHNHCGSQQDFMTWCRKFWGKQYTWKKTTKSGTTKSRSYTFPKAQNRVTRRYRRAA